MTVAVATLKAQAELSRPSRYERNRATNHIKHSFATLLNCIFIQKLPDANPSIANFSGLIRPGALL